MEAAGSIRETTKEAGGPERPVRGWWVREANERLWAREARERLVGQGGQ